METSLNYRFAMIQLEGLKRFRDELDQEIASLERIVGQFNGNSVTLPTEGTYTAVLTGLIYELLLAERPLHRKVILERLEAEGIFVSGQDKLRTLSAHLSHDDRFTPTERGFWTLANPPVTVRVEPSPELGVSLYVSPSESTTPPADKVVHGSFNKQHPLADNYPAKSQ